MAYLLGYDIGSSSVKASLIDAQTGNCVAAAFSPSKEMEISSPQAGFAEQHPDLWWQNLKASTAQVLATSKVAKNDILAIGISYQMHGLVLVDKNLEVLRPAIIWCDSRAVETGNKAFKNIGSEQCLNYLLNSPGNFTASKLKWVKDNQPELYNKVYKFMLPGDYIALKLTGTLCTTNTGLSEGIFWDFTKNQVSDLIMAEYGFDKSLVPELAPVFGVQGKVNAKASAELGLPEGIPVSYRAGDQPNNALSLNVLNPGEVAATAGTSGVVYGVSGVAKPDLKSRVNSFAHVNHTSQDARLGILLCINGTGILYSWLKNNLAAGLSYNDLNDLAAKVPVGSEGLTILPFGNGAERVLENQNPGSYFAGINFNRHGLGHLVRAAQEGIVFSFYYGMKIMENLGVNPSVVRAGAANMFQSPIFRQSLSTLSGATIELYNTDGAQGAARGAGIGCGYYASAKEAFSNLQKIETIQPDNSQKAALDAAYGKWESALEKI
jgi:xylulokinase